MTTAEKDTKKTEKPLFGECGSEIRFTHVKLSDIETILTVVGGENYVIQINETLFGDVVKVSCGLPLITEIHKEHPACCGGKISGRVATPLRSNLSEQEPQTKKFENCSTGIEFFGELILTKKLEGKKAGNSLVPASLKSSWFKDFEKQLVLV